MRTNLAVPALLLAAALGLQAQSAAQTGSFTTYGSGCSAGGGIGCLSSNIGSPIRNLTGSFANFAIKVNSGSTLRVICGFELRCSRPAGSTNMNVWIYDAAPSGGPGNILGSSTMPVNTTEQLYTATFSVPILINANTDFFVAFDNRVALNLPIGTGQSETHYWNGPPTWSGPFTGNAWNYNVLCCGGSGVPAIGNNGVPTIGKSFSIDLTNGTASANCLLAVGLGRTGIALDPAGAPGCTLYTNPVFLLGGQTNASGFYAQSVTLPNDPLLVGFKVHCQYGVPTLGNALGLIFTPGGEIVPGR
ncbi:MAG: hypothetical protein KDC87_19970 [Planctomycetes bacterium]|nr:hypothetical protein [Planctomycetota bacterium]MCB9869687.1 hypothetical protein [Planctomycetota bacterium]